MKLEDLPKKPIYNAPEGYFEQLPGRIQKRISTEGESKHSFFYAFRFQLAAAVVLLAVGVWWFLPQQQLSDAESILATVQTEDMVAYLDDSDLTTEDVLEHGEFDMFDAEEIETEVYELNTTDEELDEIIDNLDIDNI